MSAESGTHAFGPRHGSDDSLKCNVEFGGWLLSGGYQGLELMDGGFSYSSQETTAGSSYQEYSIEAVSCSKSVCFYDCCANEPWPIITCTRPARA